MGFILLRRGYAGHGRPYFFLFMADPGFYVDSWFPEGFLHILNTALLTSNEVDVYVLRHSPQPGADLF